MLNEQENNRQGDAALIRGEWGKGMWWMIAAMMVMGVMLAFQEIRDLDIGFHLKAGEWILENMRFPGNDPFTYTITDRPYIDMYWLYQVTLALTNNIAGPFGMVLLNGLAVGCSIFLLFRRTAQLVTLNNPYVAPVLFVAVMTCSYFFFIRPHIFSWIFLNLLLFFLERYRRDRSAALWPIALIMLLWVNTHALFILGWIVFFCYFVGDSLKNRKADVNLLKWSAIAVAACFINPYFYEGAVLLPLEQFGFLQSGNLYKDMIGEYMSPFSGFTFAWYSLDGSFILFQPALFFHLFILLTVVGLLLRWLRGGIRWVEFLLFAFFTFVLLSAFKNIGYFVMVVAPIVAAGFASLVKKKEGEVEMEEAQSGGGGTAATRWSLIAVGVLCFLTCVRVVTDDYWVAWRGLGTFGYQFADNKIPIKAAEFIRSNNLDGRILNQINFGGIFMWKLRQPIFIDARNEVIGEKFFAEYLRMATDTGKLALIEHYRPVIISFPHKNESPWLRFFHSRTDWRLVYIDQVAAVFLKQGYAPQIPAISERDLLATGPQRTKEEMEAIITNFKPDGFFAGFFRQQYSPAAEGDMMKACLRMGWNRAAAQIGIEGIRRSTINYPDLFYNTGIAFEQLRDYDLAEQCYRLHDGIVKTDYGAKALRRIEQLKQQ
ncbi:MAG: hypothetical protein IPM61_01255 [Chlorobi bacterium]|nr:MAG: hypothetical protein UZ07_CHB004002120 [Chlorobi bacterium OLB7]MBK8909934.1 hypothetical protein [Chlorobiota bacterium]MBX7218138.1 hypothetical protein [Candidatus Kapabacteria bacterium]